MKPDSEHDSKAKRRAVLKTAWLLVAAVFAIYAFFIARGIMQSLS